MTDRERKRFREELAVEFHELYREAASGKVTFNGSSAIERIVDKICDRLDRLDHRTRE